MGKRSDYLEENSAQGDVWPLTLTLNPYRQVEGLNIPMSVGPPCVDRDNAGEECIVYDVIINPKVLRCCRRL